MKQFYLFVPLACWCALSAPAQDLTERSTAFNTLPVSKKEVPLAFHSGDPQKRLQQWKKEDDQVNGHIDRGLLKAMIKTTQAIVALLGDSCLSEGPFIPYWHGEYFSEKRSLSPRMKFGLECHFQADGNRENGAQIRVIANDIAILFRDSLYVNGKSFQTLRGTTMIKNGFTYLEYKMTGEDLAEEKPVQERLWLITAGPDKSPYMTVTRKEYLEEAVQEVKDEKNKLIAAIKERAPLKSAEAQKAEKETALNELRQTYSGPELEMRTRWFMQSYKTDEDYQKEQVDKGTVEVDGVIQLMDSLLQHSSADDLKKPAVISVQAMNFGGFEDSLADRSILVKINPSYFDLALTAEKPQCFIVCSGYKPSEPAAADIDRQLNDKFDFKKLQELLGK
jgi:hypothetical protein